MPIDVDKPEGQAFKHMAGLLADRRNGRRGTQVFDRTLEKSNGVPPGLDLLWDYMQGDPPLSRVHQAWKDYVRQLFRMGRLNIAQLLISSTANRMAIWGFRTSAANDEQGDVRAGEIMRENGYEVTYRDLHRLVLGLGHGYTLAQPPAQGRTHAIVTAEDPRYCITMDDPLTRIAKRGLKLNRDEWDSRDEAYVYLPGGDIMKAVKEGRTTITEGTFRWSKGWEWDEEWSSQGTAIERTPGGIMPLVHFENEFGRSELDGHLDHLDRINDKIFNEWWTGKIQAFRQRAVKNLPDEDEKGNKVDYTDMFTAAPDEMWQVPADVEFWESQPIDVRGIVDSIQKDLERLAAAASQPLHTITPDAANGSAEGASLMREEHLYKIGDRMTRFDLGHRRTMANLFAFSDEADDKKRAEVGQIEAIWGPTERHSLEAIADAVAKVKGSLPLEAIWTDIMGYRPSDVPRLRELLGRDLAYGITAATITGGANTSSSTGAPAPAPAPAPQPAAA